MGLVVRRCFQCSLPFREMEADAPGAVYQASRPRALCLYTATMIKAAMGLG